MATEYNGQPYRIGPFIPESVDIASTTNASPIVVTTATPHGCTTGDSVIVKNHLVNTAANGDWRAIVTSPTTLILDESVGNGVGGATGQLRPQTFGTLIQIITDGDRPRAVTWNTPYEALADRCAFLWKRMGWNLQIFDAGTLRVLSGARHTSENGSFTDHKGEEVYYSTASAQYEGGSETRWMSGAIWELISGAVARIYTQVDVKSTGSIRFESSALLRCLAGSLADFFGIVSFVGATIATDSSSTHADGGTTTRTGPTILSGNSAYVGRRIVLFDGAGGRPNGDSNLDVDAHRYDTIFFPSLSGTKTWRLKSPPSDRTVRVRIRRFSTGTVDALIIKDDDSGATIFTFPDGDVGTTNKNQWADFTFTNGDGMGTAWILEAYGGPLT